MQVRDIMSSPAIVVNSETSIPEVARIMREHQISGVPVTDQNGQLLGVITDHDLITRSAPLQEPRYISVLSAYIPLSLDDHREYREQLRHALATNAAELMSQEVETVTPDTSFEDAIKLMLDPENTLLAVIEDYQLVGVLTRTDMVRLIERLESSLNDDENGEPAA